MNLQDKSLLEKAVQLAGYAMREGCAPVGAVLANKDGYVIGTASSWVKPAGDKEKETVSIEHAELSLILTQCGNMSKEYGPYTLYVSLEPCHMCMGAAIVARIGRVVWALDDHWGGATRMYDVSREYIKMRMPELVRTPYPDLQKQAADMWVEHLNEYNLPTYIDRMLRWQHRIE